MKTFRVAVTIVLLLFVGVTIGTLVSQEVSLARATQEAESIDSKSPDMQKSAAEVNTTENPISSSDQFPSQEGTGSEDAAVQPPDDSTMSNAPDPQGPEEEEAVEDGAPCTVRAIYFHNTHRCYTCLKIEEAAKGVMEAQFAAAFSDGRLEWSAVNMEQERLYIAAYDLSMPTLVLVRFVGGEEQEWIALEDTWKLIRSEARFAMYIKDQVRAFLGACL